MTILMCHIWGYVNTNETWAAVETIICESVNALNRIVVLTHNLLYDCILYGLLNSPWSPCIVFEWRGAAWAFCWTSLFTFHRRNKTSYTFEVTRGWLDDKMQFRWTVPLSFVFDLPDLSNAAFGDDIKSLYENINVYERLKVSREKEKQLKYYNVIWFRTKRENCRSLNMKSNGFFFTHIHTVLYFWLSDP